jgi:hypothetical protein
VMSLKRNSTSSLYVDEELNENHVIHLVREVWDGSAVEELILVTDVHIEIF